MKRLILIRHAHRNTDDRLRDNGLSEKGLEQVKKLVKFAQTRIDDEDFKRIVFFTSPKKRCQETIAPIAKSFDFKVEIEERLDEHGAAESSALYLARVDEFLDFWKYEGPETTVVCSHGDWIPVAIERLTGARIGIKKAGWIEVEYTSGECFLTWIVQKV